jgi:tetratricopeptide (TPR) repeat protein
MSFLFSVLLLTSLHAQPLTPTDIRKADLKSLMEESKVIFAEIANDEFDKAKEDIDKIEKKAPFFPVQYCLWSELYYKLMSNYFTLEFEPALVKNLDAGIKAFKNMSFNDKELESRRLQFLGFLVGQQGLYTALKGNWMSAFNYGKGAKDFLVKSLEMNPSLSDNKAGIGIYLYWRSKNATFLKYLFLWGDRRAEGVKLIEEAVKDNGMMKHWAMQSLIGIYSSEKKYAEALSLADNFLKIYPKNKGVLAQKAFVYTDENKFDKAIAIYNELYRMLDEHKQSFKITNTKLLLMAAILELSEHIKQPVTNNQMDVFKKDFDKIKNNVTESFIDTKKIVQSLEKRFNTNS